MAEAETAGQDHVVIVACPEGIGPGELLLVEAEDGLEIEAEVPAGIAVGQEFEVSVPAALAAMKQREADRERQTEGGKKETSTESASPEESPAKERQPRRETESDSQSGPVWLLRAAEGHWEPLWMDLTGAALSFKRNREEAGFLRVASVEACAVRVPKTRRHGRPHAFRVDLSSKDSVGDVRYVIHTEHFSELQSWLMALSAHCEEGVDKTLKLLSDRGLDTVSERQREREREGEIVLQDRQFQLTVQKNYIVKKTTGLSLTALVLSELEMRLQKKLNLADRVCIELLDEDFEEKAVVMSLDDLPDVCQIYVQLGEKRSRALRRVTERDTETHTEAQRIRARHEVVALKQKQLQAMEQEQYEDCALLRDAMRVLEEGLQAAEAVVSSKKREKREAESATEVPEQLEGDVATFERLAKPLLSDVKQGERQRPRSPSTRGTSPSQRGHRDRERLDPAVSAVLADLPEPAARTNRTAPLSRIQQATLLRLVGAIETLQKNLRSLSYDHGGQNAQKLFDLFDIRRTKRLTLKEFTASVRKGGKIKPQQMNAGELSELFRVICVKEDGFLECPQFASFVWRAASDVLAADVIAGVDSKGRPRTKKGGEPNRNRKPLRQGYDDGAEAHKRRLLSPQRGLHTVPRPHVLLADHTRPMMDPLDWSSGASNPLYMATQPATFGSRKRDHAEKAGERSRSLRVQALVSPPRGARQRDREADGRPAEYHGTETYRAGFATPKKAEWRTKQSSGGTPRGTEDDSEGGKRPRAAAKEKDEKWRAKVDSYSAQKKKREEAREARDRHWREKVDGYVSARQANMEARAVQKVNMDKERLERVRHRPHVVHKTPKTNAELEALTTRLSSPPARERMSNTIQMLEQKHQEAMVQHSKVRRVSQKKAAELAEKLTNQGTVEPRSLRTRPEDYERIKKEKRLAEYSVRLSSPDRSMDGTQSFSSLSAMKSGGRSPQRARTPSGRRKSARSPQLQRFLERQQEAIDLQRANLLQKKARLLEEEKALMNSSKVARTVGKSDRQRALKLRSPPRSVTTPREGYNRSPMRASAGSPGSRAARSTSSGVSSPKVAVVGEVVHSVGVTESGVTVPVAKARVRQVEPDESVSSWSVLEEDAAAGPSPSRVHDSVEVRVAAAVASASATSPQVAGKGFALPGREERNALFDRFDANGNGGLSLAEIDKAVVELWPHFDHKRALMRAYKAADANSDGLIKRREFRLLLKYIVYFNDLWDTFESLDTNDDHRLSREEFGQGVSALAMKLSPREVAAAFEAMDADGGGYVLFDEFCGWCAKAMVSAEVEEVEAQVTAVFRLPASLPARLPPCLPACLSACL